MKHYSAMFLQDMAIPANGSGFVPIEIPYAVLDLDLELKLNIYPYKKYRLTTNIEVLSILVDNPSNQVAQYVAGELFAEITIVNEVVNVNIKAASPSRVLEVLSRRPIELNGGDQT